MSSQRIVALADRRTKRLLGDDLRQHDIGIRVGKLQPRGVEPRRIGGKRIATATIIGLDRFIDRREGHTFERHVILPEIIGEIKLGGGALLHADRGVVELERGIYFQRFAHHKSLAVVEIHRRKVDAEGGIALHGPGGVARQDVDLAGLQRREAVGGNERHEFDLGRIVENCGGEGPAEIDVKSGPVALRIGHAESGQLAV